MRDPNQERNPRLQSSAGGADGLTGRGQIGPMVATGAARQPRRTAESEEAMHSRDHPILGGPR
jgi:hypothetical protein